MAVDRQLK